MVGYVTIVASLIIVRAGEEDPLFYTRSSCQTLPERSFLLLVCQTSFLSGGEWFRCLNSRFLPLMEGDPFFCGWGKIHSFLVRWSEVIGLEGVNRSGKWQENSGETKLICMGKFFFWGTMRMSLVGGENNYILNAGSFLIECGLSVVVNIKLIRTFFVR